MKVMSVRIEAVNGHQLALSGDLDAVVTLPVAGDSLTALS